MPGTITYPLTSITFDGVTLGAYTDIYEDLTVLLGTTDGADDLGRVRIKGAPTSTTIPLPRTSRGVQNGLLNVQDNAYITVLWDFRPWAKIPFFSDNGNGIDYKDGNVEVGTYNTNLPPVANAGPYMAGYINTDTSVLEVQFPGGGIDLSYAMADGATIDTYNWDVAGGTITVGTSASAVITATFPAGAYWVSLTVTDSNGVSHTARTFVLAIDATEDPTLNHYQLSQSIGKDGQTLDMDLHETLTRASYPDGTLVLFWWNGPEDASDRSHMKFTGWLDNEKYSVGRGKLGIRRSTTLHAIDIAGWLKQLPGFAQALYRTEEKDEHDNPISPWSYMPSLDMKKAIWYVGFWHTTAFGIADFLFPSDTALEDYDTMRIDSGANSIFEQLAGLAQKVVPDHYVTCNTLGQLMVIRDWRLDEVGDRPTTSPIITEDDWNNLEVDYNRHPKYHSLKSGAVLVSTAFVDANGDGEVDDLPLVFSMAPGDTAAFGQGVGEQVESEGLALSQDDLNESEGQRWALINSYYGEFTFDDPTRELFWDYEPALFNRVQLNIGASYAAFRDLPFTQCTGMVEQIAVSYTATQRGGTIKAKVTFTKDESGFPAVTYVPEDTEDVGYVPTFPVDTVVPDYGLISTSEKVVAIDLDGHVYRTSNFLDSSPTWDRLLVTGDVPNLVFSFVVDPFSPGYRNVSGGKINGWAIDNAKIYYYEDLFGATTSTAVYTFAVGGVGHAIKRTVAVSFGRYQTAEADNPWIMAISYYSSSPADGFKIVYSVDGGTTWSSEITVSSSVPTGSSAGLTFQAPTIWMSPRTPGKAIVIVPISTAATPTMTAYVTTDWGETWSALSDPLIQAGNGFGGTIHVPWEDNDDESIVYYGNITDGTTFAYRVKKSVSTTVTDISPTFSSKTYGVGLAGGGFGIRAYDNDRQYMAMAGVSDNGTGTTSFQLNVAVSSDGGNTWNQIVAPYGSGNWLGWQSYQVAFSSDDPNVIYIIGAFSVENTTHIISYTDDFGATVQDKTGNLKTDFFDVDSSPNAFVAIAGGPTAT